VQSVDPKTLALQGEPALLADSVNQSTAYGAAAFSVSDAPIGKNSRGGVIVFRAASAGNRRLFSYNREGKRSEIARDLGSFSQISLSPDDQNVAIQRYRSAGNSDIDLWLLRLSDGVYSRLTSDEGNEDDPRWSADSRRLIFDFRGKGKNELREITLGSSAETLVYDGGTHSLDDWTHDGKYLIYHSRVAPELFVLPLEGERKPRSVRRGGFQTDQVYVSPDGRWVTFGSDESGQWEVYVAAFPSFTEQRQISREGGAQPTWRKDGRELFYLSPNRQMMAVEVRSGATLETDVPKPLFQTSIPYQTNLDLYAVTRDGQRFLAVEPSGEAAKESLNVITNWASALEK
jgi:Tol biopolymer transport system component